MTSPRRRAAAAMVAGIAAGVAVLAIVPAGAGVFDHEWGRSWDDGIEDGMTFAGDNVRLSGNFVFDEAGREGGAITDVFLTMTGGDTESCPNLEMSVHVRDGDSAAAPTPRPDPTTDPTAPPTTPTTAAPVPSDANTFDFSFTAVPACNGIYDVVVTAVADPAGFAERDETDGDEVLRLEDVRVGLRPPIVPSVNATANLDSSVTVTWTTPSGYDAAAAAAPADFLGFGIQRSDRGGEFVHVGDADPGATAWTDRSLPAGAAGVFRYRVFAVRHGASVGTIVVGDPAATPIAQVTVGTPPTTGGGSGGIRPVPRPTGGGGRTSSGVPVSGPTTTIDEGFASTLPFDDDAIVGPEDAVLPEDAAGLFELEADRPGSGLLVPFAIAMVLLVWSLHLRHLSRRAAGPA